MERLTAKTHLQIASKLKSLKDKIENGTMVVIDPSSKSMGYCVTVDGKIDQNGVIKTTKATIGERLRDLFEQVSQLPQADVVIIEFVRTGTGHQYLVWSVGVAAAAANSSITIEIPTSMWSKYKDSEYYKSDAMDAKYMAKCVLQIIKD